MWSELGSECAISEVVQIHDDKVHRVAGALADVQWSRLLEVGRKWKARFGWVVHPTWKPKPLSMKSLVDKSEPGVKPKPYFL